MTLMTRSRPSAATYISRARARRLGPAGQSSRHVTADRSLSPAVSLFFQPRRACTEFRSRVQIPQSRSAEFRTPVPHSTEIPHLFRILLRILGGLLGAGQGSGSLRSVVRTACETPAIPLLSPPIYSQRVSRCSTLFLLIDRH